MSAARTSQSSPQTDAHDAAGQLRRQLAAVGAFDVDHGGGPAGLRSRRQVGREEPLLGGPIGLHVAMEIEMVLAQVGEDGRVQPAAVDPGEIDGVRGRLDDGMRHARRAHIGQHALQVQRLGSRHRVGEAIGRRSGS